MVLQSECPSRCTLTCNWHVTVLRDGVFRKLLGHRPLDIHSKPTASFPTRPSSDRQTPVHSPGSSWYLVQHCPPKASRLRSSAPSQHTCKRSSKYSTFPLYLQPYSEFLPSLSGLIMIDTPPPSPSFSISSLHRAISSTPPPAKQSLVPLKCHRQ